MCKEKDWPQSRPTKTFESLREVVLKCGPQISIISITGELLEMTLLGPNDLYFNETSTGL